ncbi:hypothetical protein [Baaleninema sp.]|uniref:hypothetical protein n=1 Tax=Baaleninema sp. TaxID=3101197 RepID=UPI003CFD7C02
MASVDTEYQLSERQWHLAHLVAQQLVRRDTDPNELGKVMAYLRAIADRPDAGERFFKYLKTLSSQGDKIAHSQQTQEYFASMNEVCQEYLQGEVSKPEVLMQIIGWSFRLMRYYKEGVPPGERNQKFGEFKEQLQNHESQYKKSLKKLSQKQSFHVGQILEAEVIKKKQKGSEVTYNYLGVSFAEKEAKKFNLIPENKVVKVEIKSLKEDGTINHIKFVSE